MPHTQGLSNQVCIHMFALSYSRSQTASTETNLRKHRSQTAMAPVILMQAKKMEVKKMEKGRKVSMWQQKKNLSRIQMEWNSFPPSIHIGTDNQQTRR